MSLRLGFVSMLLAACSSTAPGASSGPDGSTGSTGSHTSGVATTGRASSTGATASTSGSTTSGSGTSGSAAATTGAPASTGAASTSGATSTSGGGCSDGFADGFADGFGCSAAGGAYGVCCNGSCAAVESDPTNCGGCGALCPAGATCANGLCTLASCAGAAPGYGCAISGGGAGVCCGGSCLAASDLASDPDNCGACGAACATGQTCASGACLLDDDGGDGCLSTPCAAGQICAANYPWACILDDCSSAGAGTVCSPSISFSDGNATGICCGGACVDPIADPANCSACGVACAGGQACLAGACVAAPPACGPTSVNTPCLTGAGTDGRCCGADCVALDDQQNCFGCGFACPDGTECEDGECVIPGDGGVLGCDFPEGIPNIYGTAPCPAGDGCAENFKCAPSACPSDGGFGFCLLGGFDSAVGVCCGGACVDPSQDPSNCGACGIACASGVCTAPANAALGVCVPAASGNGCGAGCPSGQACVEGLCLETSCAGSGTALCTLNGAVGECCSSAGGCVSLLTDPANCGGCGFACAAGDTCANGVCSSASTASGCGVGHVYMACSFAGEAAGGFGLCCPSGGCVDLTSDSNNCGFCGQVCGTGTTCQQSVCQ